MLKASHCQLHRLKQGTPTHASKHHKGCITEGHNHKRHLSMQKAPSGVNDGATIVEAVGIPVSELGATSGVVTEPIGKWCNKRPLVVSSPHRSTSERCVAPPGGPACSVVPRVVVAEVLGVVLALLEVLLQSERHRQLHDVVSSHALEDGEATHVLQGVDRLEAGDRKEELDGSGREAGGAGTQEVEEAPTA